MTEPGEWIFQMSELLNQTAETGVLCFLIIYLGVGALFLTRVAVAHHRFAGGGRHV